MSEGDKVFVTNEITNKDIYDMLVTHGESLKRVEDQTTKTNGRVTNLEDLTRKTCIRVSSLEQRNIVMFVSKYKYVILSCIAIGMLIAGWNLERIIGIFK